MYVELHARSAFSFLEGACLPEELAGACAHFDMPAMAIMDRNGVYGAPRFHLAAKKAGIARARSAPKSPAPTAAPTRCSSKRARATRTSAAWSPA